MNTKGFLQLPSQGLQYLVTGKSTLVQIPSEELHIVATAIVAIVSNILLSLAWPTHYALWVIT